MAVAEPVAHGISWPTDVGSSTSVARPPAGWEPFSGGADWLEAVHPEDRPRAARAWTQALENGTPYRCEYRLRRMDGSYRRVRSRATPLLNADGSVREWLGSLEELPMSEDTDRGTDAETQFERQLVGIASHDLRSPLMAILLSAQSLRKEPPSGGSAERHIGRIINSSERALRMVRDLLDFTQARSGTGLRIERKPFHMGAFVDLLMDELRAAHPERVVQLHRSGDCHGAWDPDRMAQLVTNLVGNALKYSPPSSVVKVRVEGQGDSVELHFHNEGKPIPRALIPKLFEPMRRGTLQVDRSGHSIGLGLFIVKHIVDAHGGTVGVSSNREDGTNVRVRLPRAG